MTTPHRPLLTPIEAVIFDCDGTLSTIEGIDELARQNGVGESVSALTTEAMARTGMNLELYKQRLDLVRPTLKQVLELGKIYLDHLVPDVLPVIETFQRLHKKLYIVSAGLLPSVLIFGKSLGIDERNIYAVDVQFDAQGNYLDFDRNSSLTRREGKREIVADLKAKHQTLLYIGDGLNDLAAYDLVTRFVGYGGSYYRENIAKKCEFYINEPTMKPLLRLGLTEDEWIAL